jgi:hypothetical protein
VGEVGQQAASVGDADAGVQCDRLPDFVDVGFRDTLLPQHTGSEIGALHLEASLTLRVRTESEVVHHGGREEQVLVVGHIVQTALMVGEQAGEQEAADAVVDDGLALRRLGERKACLGQRPRRKDEDVVHGSTVGRLAIVQQWPGSH